MATSSRPNLVKPLRISLQSHGQFEYVCDFFVLPQEQIVTLRGGPTYCRQTAANDLGRGIVSTILPLSEDLCGPGVVFSKDLVPKDKYLTLYYSWYRYGVASIKKGAFRQQMMYALLATFSRIVAGSPHKVVVTVTVPHTGYNKVTAHLSNALVCNKRLLHGTLGLFRDIIEFSMRHERPANNSGGGPIMVYKDLLPSYPFASVKKALTQDDLPTIRSILLEALESLSMFRGAANNSPCSLANIDRLRFIAEKCNGPEMFMVNTSKVKAKLTANPASMYGARTMGGRYYGYDHTKVRYNILPNWTSSYYGGIGWWESGKERVFTKAKRKEFKQYLAAPKVEVVEEQS